MRDAIDRLRREYRARRFDEADAAGDPFEQFRRWFAEVDQVGEGHEANAMTLATATPEGRPSARVVLLKGLDDRGFVFYTNYESAKGEALAANPHAALVFFWPHLERQVRVEGTVERVTAAESDEYFAQRPPGARVGAWASPQSRVIADRAALEARVGEALGRFEGGEVPRPPHWGGYRVLPEVMEFWQGRESRLHDRLRYSLRDGRWALERLAP